MGYYTDYKLSASNQEILDIIVRDNDTYTFQAMNKYEDGSYHVNAKWYEHEEELCQISLDHSDILFILDGHGEEHGDEWRKYFKNGMIHDSILSFSDFDPNKMRKPKIL